MSVAPGQTLSHFRLQEEIGAGGMGVVYRARDLHLERDVAIKVLPAGTLTDPATRARFRKEALALSQLNHPAIATVFDFDTQDEIDFLVMEYVPGTSLDEKLVGDALAESEIVALSIQLAKGLAEAHTQGIVHRDLKPANLRVMPDGRLKILDFGLAKLFTPGGETATAETQTGGILGTVPYMAPEQLSGGRIDVRTDVYAAGNVLHEMATGRRPHSETDMARLMYAIAHETPPAPRSSNPRISPALDAVIRKATEKAPESRYQSAQELVDDLRRLEAGVPVTAPKRQAGRGLRWVGLMVAVLVLFAALVEMDVGGLRRHLLGGSGETRIASLAVLPLKNLSGDPEQAYFVDGMTEALITDLSRIGELKVISRFSAMRYKGTDKPLAEIARELGVDALIEGSVLREDDRVAITAHLVEAVNQESLWSRRYEREVTSVLAMHGEMARTIADEIAIRLTPDERTILSDRGSVNPRTYEAYLLGMHHLDKGTTEGFQRGIEYLNEAIEHDAGDPRAYAGLALGYIRTGHDGAPPEIAFPRAIAAANRALALDPNLAEAHAAIADAKMYYEWDFDGARKAFERAVELNPNLAEAHAHYGWYYAIYGRWEKAVAEGRRAQELDPLSPTYTGWLGAMLWYMDDLEAAMIETRKSLDLNPDYSLGWWALGSILGSQGRHDEAIDAHRKASELSPNWTWALAGSLGRAGRNDEARRVLEGWEGNANPARSLGVASALGYMGETDEAIPCMQRAYDARVSWMPWIAVAPELRSLHGDPRFQEMLRRMNILE